MVRSENLDEEMPPPSKRRIAGMPLAKGSRRLASIAAKKRSPKKRNSEIRFSVYSLQAVLVVAKLDRLARNVAFTSKLMEAEVEFVACDNPTANRLTIHILAAVAEDEARRISDRTKAALAAAKARGVMLGSAREGHFDGMEERRAEWLQKASQAAAESHTKNADAAYADIIGEMQAMRADGLSLRAIAAKLTEQGHTTRRGKDWNQVQVRNVLLRFAD